MSNKKINKSNEIEEIKKERSKFNVSADVSKRTYEDIVFDSELERDYYKEYLIPRINNGEILKVERQKTFILQPDFTKDNKKILPITYVCDFEVTYSNGTIEILDTKGMADPTAILKRKMFWYLYPDLVLRWIGYSKIDGGWVDKEIIDKGRKERKKAKEAIDLEELISKGYINPDELIGKNIQYKRKLIKQKLKEIKESKGNKKK